MTETSTALTILDSEIIVMLKRKKKKKGKTEERTEVIGVPHRKFRQNNCI